MKTFVLIFILISTLFAKVDYSVMSTEELLAMMGYVPAKNEKAFKNELSKRVQSMSAKEKKIYLKNLKKREK
jgi:hypothetical protein